MNKYKIDIFSYISTILWSLLAAIIFSGGLIYYAQYDVINNSSVKCDDKVLHEYIKNTVITQNENLETEHPEDYRIDLHLGYLYKIIEEYDKAEYYYMKAIKKAPLGIYRPYYELANFYIEIGKFDKAEIVMKIFPEKANAPIIKYQSYLNRKMADMYYDKEKYYYALNKYIKAKDFWIKLNKPSIGYINSLNERIAITAIDLADIIVNANKIDEAVYFLKIAENARPKDFNVRYKLALVLSESDPEESYKYFKKLFDENPLKIDYKAYYKLLENLSLIYQCEGDYTKAKLFAFRANHLLEFVSEYLIYAKDIDFKILEKKIFTSNNKSKIIFKYNLKNISDMTFKRLNIDVVYKLYGKEIETYSRNIIGTTNYLYAGDDITGTIIPKKTKKYSQQDIKNITMEIYLYKQNNRKLCIYNDYLFNDKEKINQSNLGLDWRSNIEFFVKQILNFDNSIKIYKDSR